MIHNEKLERWASGPAINGVHARDEYGHRARILFVELSPVGQRLCAASLKSSHLSNKEIARHAYESTTAGHKFVRKHLGDVGH
jgi:hypothetical protein